jgi:hypothetical protein
VPNIIKMLGVSALAPVWGINATATTAPRRFS